MVNGSLSLDPPTRLCPQRVLLNPPELALGEGEYGLMGVQAETAIYHYTVGLVLMSGSRTPGYFPFDLGIL